MTQGSGNLKNEPDSQFFLPKNNFNHFWATGSVTRFLGMFFENVFLPFTKLQSGQIKTLNNYFIF